jgi:hypothetical protein
MTRRRRIVLWVAGVAVAIAILALLAPASAGSGGLVVLHRFLPAVGTPIQEGAEPPTSGTFFLPVDQRTDEEIDPLLSWVAGSESRQLVVTDPSSAIFERFGVTTTSRIGFAGTTTILNDCVRPETLGVGAIEVSSSDRLLATTQGSPCFAIGDASYVVFVRHGSGTVVLIGGPSFLTDDLLNHADNAVFTLDLFGSGPVVVGPATPPTSASSSIWGVLPTGAKAVVWELIIATVVFAFARGRRLGRPIDEEPISPIPSGELVLATGRLYRRARAVAFCGSLLREWTAGRLTRRTGVAPDPDRARLSVALARTASVPVDRIKQVLAGPDPTTDEQLAALGRELESVADQIEGVPR